MKIAFAVIFLCLLNTCLVESLAGDELLPVNLLADASTSPPGDILELAVLRQGGDDTGNIEFLIEAFVLDRSENKPKLVRVQSDHNEFADDQGLFRYIQDVNGLKQPAPSIVKGRVVIPYSVIKLQAGTYSLGYRVSVLNGTSPTPLTGFSRFREIRVVDKTVSRTMGTGPRENEEVISIARLNVESARGEKKEPDQRIIKLLRTVAVASTGKREEKKIRGGFFPSENIDSPPGLDESDIKGVEKQPTAMLSTLVEKHSRIVYFSTNRKLIESESDMTFGNELGELTYGSCLVNVPITAQQTKRAAGSKFFAADTLNKYVVSNLRMANSTDWASMSEDDLLLYVHGFNCKFQKTLARAAQLKHETSFNGKVLVFAWPSQGTLKSYAQDTVNAKRSVNALADTLRTVLLGNKKNKDKGKLHIIAHSMGNRVLLSAIAQLYEDETIIIGRKPFGEIILAAPDVGALQFNNLLPYATKFSERVTYYYCKKDRALQASRQINNYEPVGLCAFFEDKLDTINADDASTDFIGHGYYASSHEVLSDISLLLNHRLPPAKRMPPLKSSSRVLGHTHWAFGDIDVKLLD